MSDEEPESHPMYFVDEASVAGFNKAFAKLIAGRQKKAVEQIISTKNQQRLRHGGQWNHPGLPELPNGNLQEHSAVAETSFEDIVNNDLGAIERSAKQLSDAMTEQMTKMLYATVAESCARTGNTVDGRSGLPMSELFFEAIEKIEFVADKAGHVSLPELHMHPDTSALMTASLAEATPDFHTRFELLKARKIRDALEREVARKAKFVRYGSNP